MSDQEKLLDRDKGPSTMDGAAAASDSVADENEAPDNLANDEVEEEQVPETELGEEMQDESSEEAAEDADELQTTLATEAKKKKQNLIKRVMEYDLVDMYPEMNVLTDKKKREWDYQDAETIRALWLESKTNVLAEWKVRYATTKKSRKPQIEVRDTTAHNLRIEYLKNKQENEKNAKQKDLMIIERGRESPTFDEVKLPTNAATDMRYKYNRNNPPVPRYYLEHFNKHKKPPFKIQAVGAGSCKP